MDEELTIQKDLIKTHLDFLNAKYEQFFEKKYMEAEIRGEKYYIFIDERNINSNVIPEKLSLIGLKNPKTAINFLFYCTNPKKYITENIDKNKINFIRYVTFYSVHGLKSKYVMKETILNKDEKKKLTDNYVDLKKLSIIFFEDPSVMRLLANPGDIIRSEIIEGDGLIYKTIDRIVSNPSKSNKNIENIIEDS